MKLEFTSIGIIGNLANVGNQLAYNFSKIGIDCKLIIHEQDIPRWNFFNPELDVHDCSHVKIIHTKFSNKLTRKLSEILTLRKFDLIISVALSGFWSIPVLKNPYICYATGSDLREIADGIGCSKWRKNRAQKIFQNAKLVFFSPDMGHINMIKKLKLKNVVPWRQFVDINYWSTKKIPNNSELHIFHPTNLQWIPSFEGQTLKRNNFLFEGFKIFLDKGGKGKLFFLKRGQNILETEKLIKKLGLENYCFPYGENLNKTQLKDAMEKMDVIVDQFHSGGGFGLISLESLSMGKPVMLNTSHKMLRLAYPEPDELPLFVSANSPEEVSNQLFRLQDVSERNSIGKQSRKWIETYHDSEKLAYWYIETIKKYTY